MRSPQPNPATSGPGEALLAVSEATAGYRGVPVVKSVSLAVRGAEISLVIGPNGAGKSTLVKAIIGELPLLGGTITFESADISKLGEELRAVRGLGYVPQVRDVFPTLTVIENLEMGGYRLKRKALKARIEEVLEVLPHLATLRHRTARQLSGGERKMLAIARGLMPDPKVLILDEPTANLAPKAAQTILHTIAANLARAGRGILLIEQRVALAAEIAGQVTVLVDGKVRLAASGEEFRAIPDVASMFFGAEDARSHASRGTVADITSPAT